MVVIVVVVREQLYWWVLSSLAAFVAETPVAGPQLVELVRTSMRTWLVATVVVVVVVAEVSNRRDHSRCSRPSWRLY